MSEHALKSAARALHGAANALNICRPYLPQEALGAAPPHLVVDPVQRDINAALDAIADVIGEKAMLEA